jgi:hypothetical protein
MTDSEPQPTGPAKRGEAAWLEAKRAVAHSNDEARKAGKAERSERERRQKAAEREQERNGVFR